MLRAFYTIRAALADAKFQANPRGIDGTITVTPANIVHLQQLQDGGHLEAERERESIDFALLDPAAPGGPVHVVLKPIQLHYYEDLQDLVRHTAEEPTEYYVFGLGWLRAKDTEVPEGVAFYRAMLRARELLRQTGDLQDGNKAIFLAPEKLEIHFRCSASDLRELAELPALLAQLASGTVEREQRLALFKKSLREHLRAHPAEERFGLFLRNFPSIYDTYSRDYQLWIGNTFGELEKSFEEKRLKFVADLNGILAGVQASILAVPVAAILLGDKYDLQNPLKNFLLAAAVNGLGLIALKLLTNQSHTLDATRKAIDATKTDFEKKQTRRKEEFKSRLEAIDGQEARVRSLLTSMRTVILVIMIGAGLAWLGSFANWLPYSSRTPLPSTPAPSSPAVNNPLQDAVTPATPVKTPR